MKTATENILSVIPSSMNSATILSFINKKPLTVSYLQCLKEVTELNDTIISEFLNMNVKTYRSFKNKRSNSPIKEEDLKEHTIVLLTLFNFGKKVFGTVESFDKWLLTENFIFDKKKPIEFLKTINGIQLIYERLVGIQYGDNA